MPAGEEVVSLIVAESAGGIEDENEDDNGVEEAVANGDALIEGADDANLRYILTATENGYGKRTHIGEYTRHGRGTKGMIAIQQSERNGKVVAATLVGTEDEIMLITDTGVLVRTRVAEIREMGRATQGVTLIALDEGAKLSGLQRIAENDANSDAEGDPEATPGEATEGDDTPEAPSAE
jgi:DNA gyrase subunit A